MILKNCYTADEFGDIKEPVTSNVDHIFNGPFSDGNYYCLDHIGCSSCSLAITYPVKAFPGFIIISYSPYELAYACFVDYTLMADTSASLHSQWLD